MKTYSYKITTLIILSLLLCISISAQTNYLQEGISLYQKGEFKKAVKMLKKVKESDKDSYLSHYFIGLSYEKRKKYKNARKEFKKSISLNPEYAKAKTGLAYTYIKSRQYKEAIKFSEEAVALDTKDYRNYYILGLSYYKLREDTKALKHIDKLIEIKPNFAEAYLIKHRAFNNDEFLKQDKSRKLSDAYAERSKVLAKFIILLSNKKDAGFWEKQRKSLDFFVNYYKQTELEENKDIKPVGLKILNKPRPGYTDRARQANISGQVRLLVALQSDGKIRHTLVLSGLGYGLDKSATRAVKGIKFEPATVNGKPVTVVKTFIMSFRIY